jgi:NADPH-dependent 2,4-dienoyl-CoA reductase/sulfur reductase-like enzyme/nitrite reductase/ring-hydroxylating ferredoxin subunit
MQDLDLTAGVAADSIADGQIVAGRVGDQDVLLVRAAGEFYAVRAQCTHYRGPLADGIVVGRTIRCPLHHACFDLTTGDALCAPALDPLPCWRVERQDGRIVVGAPLPTPSPHTRTSLPSSVVILGGGAAGLAAANTLRREGYDGPVSIVSADSDSPVDRPNLSKDYLAGEAQDDWLPLWPAELYAERRIDLALMTRAERIEPESHTVLLNDGSRREFGALLIATGAEPIQLAIPGAETTEVRYLRTFADSRAIVARTRSAKHVVVVGASFIGLEVAAALRTRRLAVTVVAPESRPFVRVMGDELGAFVQRLHEAHGVAFHLGETVAEIAGRNITLSGGTTLDADFVVVGAGVRPSIALAERSGLKIDRGIVVDEFLETSQPGIFAAGDVARWPDPRTGQHIRVEHWVVAERQAQTAARNMLGRREPFTAVPFFRSQHYDVTIRYVGHAERWDRVQIDGSLDALDATVRSLQGETPLAVATVGRDRASLEAEVAFEAQMRVVSAAGSGQTET